MEEGELSSASSASDEEGKMEDIEAEKEEGEKTESWEAGPGDAVLEESLLGALQEHLESMHSRDLRASRAARYRYN